MKPHSRGLRYIPSQTICTDIRLLLALAFQLLPFVSGMLVLSQPSKKVEKCMLTLDRKKHGNFKRKTHSIFEYFGFRII